MTAETPSRAKQDEKAAGETSKTAGRPRLILTEKMQAERFNNLKIGDEIPEDHELYSFADQMVLRGQARWYEEGQEVSRANLERKSRAW